MRCWIQKVHLSCLVISHTSFEHFSIFGFALNNLRADKLFLCEHSWEHSRSRNHKLIRCCSSILDRSHSAVFQSNFVDDHSLPRVWQSWLLFVNVMELPDSHNFAVTQFDLPCVETFCLFDFQAELVF